ncbi:hypothetical protein N3K66_005541 [Trichothecium roseum]|uniref:Uncharacterized protein n=1 Tax=Trichothecium roseum TaxID=47278 RepID=A0ACC0UYV4_9HYPO|nr:hypothetical protein N3K66_005541 [Trichothecium roseum]
MGCCTSKHNDASSEEGPRPAAVAVAPPESSPYEVPNPIPADPRAGDTGGAPELPPLPRPISPEDLSPTNNAAAGASEEPHLSPHAVAEPMVTEQEVRPNDDDDNDGRESKSSSSSSSPSGSSSNGGAGGKKDEGGREEENRGGPSELA